MLSPHLLDLLREWDDFPRTASRSRTTSRCAAHRPIALGNCRGFSRPLVGCLAGWLGREDSNLCISNWCPAVFSAVVPCGEGRSCTRLLESIGRHPCRRTVA